MEADPQASRRRGLWGKRDAERAWAGGRYSCCRSELSGGDSSAGAGWEAGILTQCGTSRAGNKQSCGCASPAPYNLLRGRGAPARHSLGLGPPVGFPSSLCSFPREPWGAVL